MPRIDKKTITRYVDAGGRRVPKDAPGARKVTELSAKYYGFGVPGYPKNKAFPLCADRAAAQRMLDDLVRSVERGMAGLPDPKAGRTPLAEYAEQFLADLAAGLASRSARPKVPSPFHIEQSERRVRAFLAGCNFRTVADLNADAPRKLSAWLTGKVARQGQPGGYSHSTAGTVLSYARRFAWWLHARANAPVRPDLFAGVPGFDPKNNRVHARRDATPEELAAFLEAAKTSARTVQRRTGSDRYHIYLTAFSTGFRAEELSHLTPAWFDPDKRTLTLPAKLTKNGKPAVQPLPPGVADALACYLVGRPPGEKIWPGKWWRRGAKMLRVDLRTAGIPYVVATPHGPTFLDFHALRHTFVSALANAGVGPKILQELARHSDVRITLGVYAHANTTDRAEAVTKLPVVGGGASDLSRMSRVELEQFAAAAVLLARGLVAALVAAPEAATRRKAS